MAVPDFNAPVKFLCCQRNSQDFAAFGVLPGKSNSTGGSTNGDTKKIFLTTDISVRYISCCNLWRQVGDSLRDSIRVSEKRGHRWASLSETRASLTGDCLTFYGEARRLNGAIHGRKT